MNPMSAWWQARAAREKTMLGWGGALVALTLVWALGFAPAWRSIQKFEVQRTALDVQIRAMERMQSQAKSLQAQPTLTQAQAAAALEATVKQSFAALADVSVRAGDATVTLRNVSADALAQWLAAARNNAHAVPLQARLTRTGTTWSGSLQMGLPAP
jgi:general secretion pathway protein M